MVEELSTIQAASLIGIHRAAVWHAIKRGNLKARRIGRSWLVDKESAIIYKNTRDQHKTGKYPRVRRKKVKPQPESNEQS